MRSRSGDTVALGRQNVRCRAAAAHIGRPRRREGPVGALGPPETELRHRTPLCRKAHAGSLGRHERLKVHQVQQRGLDELAVDDRARHPHHGLARKRQVSFAQGIYRDTGPPLGQPVKEVGRKQRTAPWGFEAPQVGDVLGTVTEPLDQRGELAGSTHHGKPTPTGVLSKKGGEARLHVREAAAPIALGHRDFVEVGQKTKVVGTVRIEASRVPNP